MTNKSMSIVAYITIIGWLISYFEYKKSTDKSPLVNYHLGQSLGLIIFSFVLSIITTALLFIVPSLGLVTSLVGIFSLVLLLLGVITASNEAIKPLPVVGRLFENKFDFSK